MDGRINRQMDGWRHGRVQAWTNGWGIVLVLEELSKAGSWNRAGQQVSMGEMRLSVLGTQEVT